MANYAKLFKKLGSFIVDHDDLYKRIGKSDNAVDIAKSSTKFLKETLPGFNTNAKNLLESALEVGDKKVVDDALQDIYYTNKKMRLADKFDKNIADLEGLGLAKDKLRDVATKYLKEAEKLSTAQDFSRFAGKLASAKKIVDPVAGISLGLLMGKKIRGNKKNDSNNE